MGRGAKKYNQDSSYLRIVLNLFRADNVSLHTHMLRQRAIFLPHVQIWVSMQNNWKYK